MINQEDSKKDLPLEEKVTPKNQEDFKRKYFEDGEGADKPNLNCPMCPPDGEEDDPEFLYNEDKPFNFHPFHIVDNSPWPMLLANSVFCLCLGVIGFFHHFTFGLFVLILGLVSTLLLATVWWRDIIREATFTGLHTAKVTQGIKLGVVLFIVSEGMFFFSFFWAFFHSSLAPSLEIGGAWPPIGLEILNPFGVPLLNTIILLTSGATITYAHHSLISFKRFDCVLALFATLILALLFTILQLSEYISAPFTISDGVYGSTFYLATGFHGIHVIIGTVFIFVCLGRQFHRHFTLFHHVGFEAAAWYWHFVDVVWLFLFVFVYIWGSL